MMRKHIRLLCLVVGVCFFINHHAYANSFSSIDTKSELPHGASPLTPDEIEYWKNNSKPLVMPSSDKIKNKVTTDTIPYIFYNGDTGETQTIYKSIIDAPLNKANSSSSSSPYNDLISVPYSNYYIAQRSCNQKRNQPITDACAIMH